MLLQVQWKEYVASTQVRPQLIEQKSKNNNIVLSAQTD